MTTSRALNRVRIALLAAAALIAAGLTCVLAAPAQAATQNFDLWAVTGAATMPGGQAVTVWGYQDSNVPVTRTGGPTLTVTVGDDVNITLHNEVGEPTGLLVQGQSMVPDLTGVIDGQQTTYSFIASRPGTFLYEAAPLPNAQHQTAMGLHGALVVLPAAPGQAYADPATAYDDDAVLVLGEIDPALSNAADPAAFDMRKFAPKYFTINGQAYPDTAAISAAPESTELLRYVNAGLTYHSMGVLGAGQTVIALDGAPLDHARHYVAETIGPGQTADALVETPASASVDLELTVYDAALSLRNSNTAGVGGMLTSIQVPGTAAPGDETGPVVSGAAVNAGTLSATADDGSGHGGSTIQAAEYYLDDVTSAGTALPAETPPYDAVSEALSASITVPAGPHVYYVRAQDAAGNWGPLTSVLVSGADVGGPTTTNPLLTPNRVNDTSTSGVAVTATADDSGSSGSVIAGAEYFIDALGANGTGNAMAVNTSSSVASIDATIPPATLNALPEGSHAVSIHAQDSQGNWGDPVTVNLTVDETGPETSGVTAAPNPNNGTLPFNSSVSAVRVIATSMTDPLSGAVNSPIDTAEAFIDTVGINGSGIRLIASDGVFSDTTEGGYLDIPLATVAAMSNGTHTVYVHAKDAAGNWGPTGSTTLLVDKTRPTVSGVSVAPNPTLGAASVTLSATGTDPAPDSTGISRAEWWRGADPGVGNGTAMTPSGGGFTASVPVTGLTDGSYPLFVRVRDAAGNWSMPGTTPLQVTTPPQPMAPLYYSTLGNTNPPGVAGTADNSDVYSWSGLAHSRSVDLTAGPYNVPASANVDGYSRASGTSFYLSFAGNTSLPGLGAVQDEDVVRWNGSGWSMYFDGSTHGMTAANLDLDAISVVSGTLYFSTLGNSNPPGTGGAADNSDIYRWNGGSSYTRVFDATANGIPAAANVDGYDRVDPNHLYLSFAADTTVTGLGPVQDEDVVYSDTGSWSVYFDGTAHGMTSGNLDVDAFDVP
jgi:hypothetical protein